MGNVGPKLNNRWLRDQNLVDGLDTKVSKMYLKDLFSYVGNVLNALPLKVVSTWDIDNRGIVFFMGMHKKIFEVDSNISKYDFMALVKNWLRRFYPQYQINKIKQRDYTSREISEIRKQCLEKGEKFNLDTYLNKSVHYTEKECGIITKTFIMQDQFMFEVNDKKYLRATGSIKLPINISEFMDNLRKMKLANKDDQDIHDYIKFNSFVVNEVFTTPVTINYKEKMMMNFFKIHFKYLSDIGIDKISEFVYESGKFSIDFNSDTYLRDSCLEYYDNRFKLLN